MARRPARLERAGAHTPRDSMWAAIRALQGTPTCSWSAVEVKFLANRKRAEPLHIDTVESYLRGLARAEPPYIELVIRDFPDGRKRAELFLWRLVRDVGVDAPRVTKDGKPVTDGLANDQMWAAMKALREFDADELAQAATTPACAVSVETAKTYLKHLERASYVALVTAARPARGGARARYRFNRIRNSGPRAPLIARDKSVLDGNTGEPVYTPGKGGKECRDQT